MMTWPVLSINKMNSRTLSIRPYTSGQPSAAVGARNMLAKTAISILWQGGYSEQALNRRRISSCPSVVCMIG
jgi:hypothetical protein